MAIKDIYDDKIKEEVLLEFLREGVIPSLNDVNRGTSAVINNRNTNQPLFDLHSSLVEQKERSSAAKYNRGMDEIKRDLEVVYNAMFEAAVDSSRIFDRSAIELKLLLSRIKDLEGRLASLLLLKKDTGGYFNFVFDVFEDFSKVDQTQTTAMVDLRSTTVHAYPFYRDMDHTFSPQGELTPPEFLTSERVGTLFTERAEVVASFAVPGQPISNIWKDSEEGNHALYRVITKQPTSVTVALTVKLFHRPWLGKPGTDLPPEPGAWFDEFLKSFDPGEDPDRVPAFTSDGDLFYYVTKVVMDPFLSNESGPMLVSVQYENPRGLANTGSGHWRNIPSTDYLKEVTDKVAWFFKKTEVTGFRFIMTKSKHDRVVDGQYQYDFGIRHISFFAQDYKPPEEGFSDTQLVSKSLSAYDSDGNKVLFNRVAVEACEHVPDTTDIEYYVDFGINEVFSGEWSQVDPVSREFPNHPQVANLGRVQIGDPEAASVATEVIGNVFSRGPGTTSNFRYYENKRNRYINIDISSGTDISEEWEIWRNVARLADNKSVLDTSEEVVECGWRFDGTWYSCWAYVDEPQGRLIDFGPNGLYINDRFTRGPTTLSKGIHRIKTQRENWYSLSGLHTITTFDDTNLTFTGSRTTYGTDGNDVTAVNTAAGTTTEDVLYPYNHKLLIEGLSYNAGFEDTDKHYIGVTRVAAVLMEHISLHDFTTNIPDSDLTRWTEVTIINDSDSTEKIKPMVKNHLVQTDENASPGTPAAQALREDFVIVKKYKSGTLADSVKLKTVFKADVNLTPHLLDYRIKLAH